MHLYFKALLMCGTIILSMSASSQPELVTSYFDVKNDWIVFEWTHPDYGIRKTIFDSGNKIKPLIHASVSKGSSSDYIYSFEIENQAGAAQLLQKIYLTHLAQIFEVASPTPRSDWEMGEYRHHGVWNWSKVMGDVRGIPAGQIQKGFSFKSKGLPAIVDVDFSGRKRDRFSGPGDEDPEGVQESFDRVFAKMKTEYPEKFINTVRRRTIGPKEIPSNFSATQAIDELIGFTRESADLGWIQEPSVLNHLKDKLELAKKENDKDKFFKTIKILRELLTEVESLYHSKPRSPITSEAYVLLKYNTAFLIEKIIAMQRPLGARVQTSTLRK